VKTECKQSSNSMEDKRSYAVYCSRECKEKARGVRRTLEGHWKTNKEKERAKTYRDNNPGQALERGRKWCKNNRASVNAKKARRRAAQHNATPSWADKEAIKRMYIVSQFLTDKIGEPHHVDHIIPLRGENICGLHVEYNLDVIPAKDNLRKGNRYA